MMNAQRTFLIAGEAEARDKDKNSLDTDKVWKINQIGSARFSA
jgi:hypothetical protein